MARQQTEDEERGGPTARLREILDGLPVDIDWRSSQMGAGDAQRGFPLVALREVYSQIFPAE